MVDCIYSLAAVYAKCGVILIEVTLFFFETFSRDMYQTWLKMDRIKENNLFCEECSLQFYEKSVYDIHMS